MVRRTVARVTTCVLAASAVPVIAVAVHATQAPNTFSSTDLPTYQTNGVAWAVAEANGLVFVGGSFTTIRPPGSAAGVNEIARTNFAVFDAATGSPTSCAPAFDLPSNPASGGVRALNVSPDKKTLYVGGFFNSISGATAQHLAALDIASCTVVSSFKPTPNGLIRAIQSTASTVYFGGSFGLIAGQSRNRAAAVGAVGSAAPGSLLAWAPAFDNDVRAMVLRPDGSAMVVGGWFDTVNGAASHALGVVSTGSGANVRTYPGMIGSSSRVHDLTADNSGFYSAHDGVGGFDGRIAFNWSNYEQRWIDTCLGATQAVTVYNGILYSGSHAHNCESMGSFPDGSRYHFLAQSVNDPKLLPWFPNTDDGIGEQIGPRDMVAATGPSGNFLWAVGEFTQVNGKPQQGLTRFGEGPGTAGPSRPITTVTSPASGQARVAWRMSLDTDDATLTYRVYRDGASTPVYTTTGTSWFWQRPQLTFTDTGLAPGSVHNYRVEVSDGTHTVTTPDRAVQVASTSSAYANRVLADGASFLWRYDDAADVFVSDASSNNNSGTIARGTAERVRPGALAGDPSGALSFPGNSSYIYSETRFPVQSAFTEETWFKTTTTAGGKLIGFGSNQLLPSGPYDKHVYMTNAGNLIFGVYAPVGPVTLKSPARYNDGAWHHVAATQGPNGMALYVDGVNVGRNAETRSEPYAGFVRAAGDNLNGWPEAPSSYHIAGTLDETALYPTALSAAAIAEHYRIGTNGGPVVVNDTAAPTSPTAVTATASGSAVTVGWTASSDNVGVSGYDVYRSATSGFTPDAATLVGSAPGTAFTNSSVPAGTWYYRVIAKDAAGNRSTASPQAAVTVAAPPAGDASAPSIPSSLAASVSGSTVSLSWPASSDNVGVVGYDVYRSATSGFTPGAGSLIGSAPGTGFTNGSVPAGTWYYRVVAKDAAGNRSGASPQAAATVSGAPAGDTAAPSTPGNLSASASGSTVSLSWSASSDNVGVSAYEVHRSSTSGFAAGASTLTGTASTNSFSQRGVPAGTWYYRVVATDAAGNRSAASAQASATVAAVVVDPPVVNPPVDPGVVVLAPTADAYVSAAQPGSSFGAGQQLVQRSNPALISYLKFAVPPTPAGKTLRSAVLRLRSTPDSQVGPIDYQLIQLAANTWGESTVTWNNRPSMTFGAFAFAAPPASDSFYQSSLHPQIIQMQSGRDATIAITSLGTGSLRSWSKESPTAGFRPQLILSYS